ncbi:beta-ketoacyl-ACP synthase III [Aestuariirhabdus sp. Z084]|uniref:beta-ketoacyl-ACP synthase III n=1 Tax=Aestuariirhabdus haliotis TaxID=2918751 RepID=UPI00201B3D0D|nr:beta-ketoacyl-ACP synthase III [Aestuariirhabdus haliotis]MCL6414633.1 beta-ketoacyl-ACP synthase III [Aestuariirhabdus haliotis]MCL6418385.1 beta-ketoacyl-ACP synthase III [Aestuariirhabdus haliotis]
MTDVVISGTGLYTPSESISNEELVEAFNAYVNRFNETHQAEIEAGEVEPMAESSAPFIEKASGIRSRFVMNKSGILDISRMCPSLPERSNDEDSIQCEMAVKAAREALDRAGRTAADVDAIICAASNMQRAYPAMAVEIQNALGAGGFAYDMNVACSSATFGLQAAVDAVRGGSAKVVLMVNPEICSGHLNFADRDSHFIFGDVCTAVLVEKKATAVSVHQFEILGTKLQTQYSNNIRNNFGFLNRADESGVGAEDKLFVQNGRKVFKEVCPMVADQISAHIEELDVPVAGVKRLWLHQANINMNNLVARKVLGRDPEPEEAPIILDEYANTSSAGSIIAFHKYQDDMKAGEQGVICSFGAGYSIGSAVLRKL